MKQIICDGCKKAEEVKGDSRAGKTIKRVQLQVWEDDRDSVPRVPHKADLCEECRADLLRSFFRGVPSAVEAILPQSLKAPLLDVRE